MTIWPENTNRSARKLCRRKPCSQRKRGKARYWRCRWTDWWLMLRKGRGCSWLKAGTSWGRSILLFQKFNSNTNRWSVTCPGSARLTTPNLTYSLTKYSSEPATQLRSSSQSATAKSRSKPATTRRSAVSGSRSPASIKNKSKARTKHRAFSTIGDRWKSSFKARSRKFQSK